MSRPNTPAPQEQKPLVHLMTPDTDLSVFVLLASFYAREKAHWDTTFLHHLEHAADRLEAERPQAFITSLVGHRNIFDKPEADDDRESLQSHWGEPEQYLPVITVVERAHDLKIPVALFTPSRQSDVERYVDENSGDMILTAAPKLMPEQVAAPITGWLTRIAGQAAQR